MDDALRRLAKKKSRRHTSHTKNRLVVKVFAISLLAGVLLGLISGTLNIGPTLTAWARRWLGG